MTKLTLPSDSLSSKAKDAESLATATPVTGTAVVEENPAINESTGEMVVQPPAPGAENAQITKDIESGASLSGATKGSPQTIDPTPQGTPGGVISDPSAPAAPADSVLSQTDRDPDPGTDQPGLNPNVPERPNPDVTVNTARTFDQWPEGEVPIEDEEVDLLNQQAYTYKHKGVRNYRVHVFQFEDHLMTVFGDQQREDFIRIWRKLPIEERNQIVEYHPEVVRNLESAVDAPRVQRGVVGSGTYPDNRVGNMRSEGQKSVLDGLKTVHA